MIGLCCAWRACPARGAGRRPRARRAAGRRDQGRRRDAGAGRRAHLRRAASCCELTLAPARLYPEFVAELEAASGVGTGYARQRRPARRPRPRRGGAAAPRPRPAALARARGRVAAAAPLPRAGARPDPSFDGGVHAAGEASIDPRALTRGAARGARRARGSRCGRGTEVVDGALEGERLDGVRTAAGEELRAGTVVLATGAWSGQRRLAARAGPAAGAPGQGPDPRAARRRRRSRRCERIVASERVYLVPRPDGRLIVGATVEERGFDTAVTAGGVHELLREAYRLLPDVAEMELVEAIAGLRPGTPDNLPLVGPGAIEGLVLATGHFRNGILLAPLTADAVAELLGDGVRPCRRRRSGPERRLGSGGADEDRAERRGRRSCRRAATLADAVARAGAGERGRAASRSPSTARSSRAASGPRRRCARARGRGAGGDPGRRREPGSWAAAQWSSRLIAGTGGFRSLEQMEAALAASGDRDRHRRPAPDRPRRRGLGARRDRPPRPLRPAQHRRLLHRPRRGPHRPARPRGLRDRVDQARGDRRRPHPLPRRGRAARRRRDSSSPTASPSSPTPTTTRSSPAASRRPAAPR